MYCHCIRLLSTAPVIMNTVENHPICKLIIPEIAEALSVVPPEEVQPDSSLDSLGMESLDTLDITARIEKVLRRQGLPLSLGRELSFKDQTPMGLTEQIEARLVTPVSA